MSGMVSKLAGAAFAIALLGSSTAAIASTASAPLPAPVSASASSTTAWTTLSAMSSASSTSATLAAQDGYRGDDGVRGIPLPVIAVLLATLGLALWIILHDDDGDIDFLPISPN